MVASTRFAGLLLVIGAAIAPASAQASAAGETLLVSRAGGLAALAPGVTADSTVSRAAGTAFQNNSPNGESISADGNRVVFLSQADNLSPLDDNHYSNVFMRDISAGTITLVSRAESGAPALGDSSDPAISADGTRVAFVTKANNLDSAAGATDANDFDDVYVRTVASSAIALVSRGASGAVFGQQPSISADGDKVAFNTATALTSPEDSNGNTDVYVRDVSAGTNALFSRLNGAGSNSPTGASTNASISDDGVTVAFESTAANLDAGDSNGDPDVFVRSGNITQIVSRADADTVLGNGRSENPALSGNGDWVAFQSVATNLGGDSNGTTDVFLRGDLDLATASQGTTLVSLRADDNQTGNPSTGPAVSADGNEVAFTATDFAMGNGDTNTFRDIHVRNVGAGTTTLASRANDETLGDGDSNFASISADGTEVAFEATAPSLSTADANEYSQVFRRDINGPGSGTTAYVSQPAGVGSNTGDGMNHSLFATAGTGAGSDRNVSQDGRYVAFISDADNLVPGQNNLARNAFRRDTQTNATIQVNVSTAGTPGAGDAASVAISDDGSKVAFAAAGSGLGDGAAVAEHVFWHDIPAGVTKLVSRRSGAAGTLPDGSFGGGTDVAISGDGTRVAYNSPAANLHPGGVGVDTNNTTDIYVRDVPTDTTLYGSAADNEALSSAGSLADNPALNFDGTKLAFDSHAPNLIAIDTNAKRDLFVRDLAAQTTIRASVSDDEVQGTFDASRASLSADGTKVGFETAAAYSAADGNFSNDIYLRDTGAGTTTLVSRGTGDATAAVLGREASLSSDGNRVAFRSGAAPFPVLAGPDANGGDDIFLRDITGATTTLVSRTAGFAAPAAVVGDSSNPSVTPDGNCVAFESQAEGLTSDYPGVDFTQIYLRGVSDCPAVAVVPPPPPPPPPPPGPGPTGPTGASPTPDRTAPRITSAKLSNRTFRVGPKATAISAAKRRTPIGTTLSYRISEPATTTITIERPTIGRIVAGKCRAQTKANRKRKRCTRYLTRGRLTRRNTTGGTKKVPFSGRIGKKALATGTYRARVSATDRSRNRSRTTNLAFKIVKR